MMSALARREEMVAPFQLPGDEVRQILWRYAGRPELQKLVLASRGVARGVVARIVADGGRDTAQWTEAKSRMLESLDRAGVSSLLVDAELGGLLAGHKNLARALAAFELAWVDGGAAVCSVALGFALAPIVYLGTPSQKQEYLRRCASRPNGTAQGIAHGAFCLTEPLPYAGVDTGELSGTVRVVEWQEGQEPILLAEKRGRLIGNMDFANFVIATVASDDPRLKGTCMLILEEGDEGTFDRGSVVSKLGHQLSSTRDPVFRLRIPASRIVGGYSVQDGVIVPQVNHLQIVHSILARARIAVGIMTAAKLLSAVEPVIRYQRGRFRRKDREAGTPRWELGLQTQQDALQRLIDVWATGEAAASLGFHAARLYDEFEQLGRGPEGPFADEQELNTPQMRDARQHATRGALEYLQLQTELSDRRDTARVEELSADRRVDYVLRESVANALSPAAKLWNTGHGANVLREAVSLMGGCGVTAECPGFLPLKWIDAQLEATYEGPESVHRRHLIGAMTHELFLAQFQAWIGQLRNLAGQRAGTGACTLASAMDLWLWTLRHLQEARDADGSPLFSTQRQGVTFPMADALSWLLAARCQTLDVVELDRHAAGQTPLDDTLLAQVRFLTDLCHVQAARTAGEVGRICTELVFGYNRHPSWDGDCGSCLIADEVDALEGVIPGISVGARMTGDVVEADGAHEGKAGPCVRFAGLYEFVRRRSKLDGCLTGARLAKDRAAQTLTRLTIPDALDYPR